MSLAQEAGPPGWISYHHGRPPGRSPLQARPMRQLDQLTHARAFHIPVCHIINCHILHVKMLFPAGCSWM